MIVPAWDLLSNKPKVHLYHTATIHHRPPSTPWLVPSSIPFADEVAHKDQSSIPPPITNYGEEKITYTAAPAPLNPLGRYSSGSRVSTYHDRCHLLINALPGSDLVLVLVRKTSTDLLQPTGISLPYKHNVLSTTQPPLDHHHLARMSLSQRPLVNLSGH